MCKRVIPFILLALVVIFSFSIAAQNAKPEKLTAEQIVARHLESIGTPQALAAAKSRVLIGKGIVTAKGGYVGRLSGPAQMASESEKLVLAVMFEANSYPFEKVGFDGDGLSFGRHVGGASPLETFLRPNKVIFKRGIFGGALGSGWALLNRAKGLELDYVGEVDIEGKRLHKVKFFTPDIGSLTVFLYFDAENFRHVRTEYRYSQSGLMSRSPSSRNVQPVFRKTDSPDQYTLTESYSNFAKAGDLTLPLSYVVDVESQTAQASWKWNVNFEQVYYNEALDISAFKVS